ncbi:MAG: YidC/Oxa1 family membrane protein insertase [Lachnospiraceae bacterium]|nr:YidC/Oxa1 family membrane protein insertase [Lachnospiraceae bacterium]
MINFIAGIFGKIMNLIFEALYSLGIKDVGLNIVISTILFTIIIYTLLLPFTIKQQKFSRISAVMNPEIQAIQNKYKGKNDQASMLKMQEETKLIYTKYGTSPTGGCLGSLIQLPFLFALWPVMREIPKHVPRVKADKVYEFMGVVISGPESNPAATPSTLLKSGETWLIIVAILIPVLAGFTQWLSGRISQNMMNSRNSDKKKEENAMASQMNMMMNVMPIMSVFLCFSMQIVLGIYWIVSAVVRIVQQIVINKVLDKKPIDVLVEENMKKAAKKNANKKEVNPSKVNSMAQKYTKKLEEIKADAVQEEKTSNNSTAKPGSLASKANMVRDYNSRNNK